MKRFLKFIVIFFGFLICFLLLVTIFTIYYKYYNDNSENINLLKLKPQIEVFYDIKDFHVEGNKLHLQLENKNNSSQIIRSYNIKKGNLLTEVEIK